jgi:hypothetical protein
MIDFLLLFVIRSETYYWENVILIGIDQGFGFISYIY